MERDAKRMRGDGPSVFAQVTNGVGVDEIVARSLARGNARSAADDRRSGRSGGLSVGWVGRVGPAGQRKGAANSRSPPPFR